MARLTTALLHVGGLRIGDPYVAPPSNGIRTAGGLIIETVGLTVTAGGITITAGGLTVSADGITVTGTSTFGSSAVTMGALTASTITSTDGTTLVRSVATDRIVLSGGTTAALGAAVFLHGESHATQARDLEVRASNVVKLRWDDSAALWDFQSLAVSMGALTASSGVVTGRAQVGNATLQDSTATTLDNLIVGQLGSGSAGILIGVGTGGSGALAFGDSLSSLNGRLIYSQTTDVLTFESFTSITTGSIPVSMGALTATTVTGTGLFLTPATVAGGAGLRLPHGTAPSSPVNGDMWTTTAGLFVRINGATVGPLS